MENLKNMEIELGGYILSVSIRYFNTINGKRKLFDYHHIKTKRQKNFRETKEFYNEFKKIKNDKNKFDKLLGWRATYVDKTLDEVVNNKEMVLEILGMEESSLLSYTKKGLKEYIETQVEKELNELEIELNEVDG